MCLPVEAVAAPRNRLLAALSAEVFATLQPRLEFVELSPQQVMHEPRTPITSVYFPETGWLSLLAYLEDGDVAELGLIGREGMVGFPALLGQDSGDLEAMVECPVTAYRIGVEALLEELERLPSLRILLFRYALTHHGRVAHAAACNGQHSVDQRLARWLLMAHDRAEDNAFPMSQEFLSIMLGVNQANVMGKVGSFQKAGFVRYEGGRMEVRDRPGLERVACECHAIARRKQDRLFTLAACHPSA